MVTLWDAETSTLMRSYQEHEKQCWSVQFCEVDPRLMASASDDSKVKVWSTNSEYSLLSIDTKSSVSCCVFKPNSKFHVLFGTADNNIHYYDLRSTKEPLMLFKGHKKAVSYVKFKGSGEFVSASTDSTLKSWRLENGLCTKTYTGHTNENNFVGLETRNGYIITGSENNNIYLYNDELSKPLLSYAFDETSSNEHANASDFISAVCWSNVRNVSYIVHSSLLVFPLLYCSCLLFSLVELSDGCQQSRPSARPGTRLGSKNTFDFILWISSVQCLGAAAEARKKGQEKQLSFPHPLCV